MGGSSGPSGDWLRAVDAFDRDKYLYRFMGRDGVLATLENRSLRLAPFATMNDPREAKAWRTIDLTRSTRLEASPPLTEADLLIAGDRMLRRGARIASFGQDRQPPPGMPATVFHRGWANSSMWDQYGERHAGGCLVFDKEVLGREFLSFTDRSPDNSIVSYTEVHYADSILEIRMGGKFSTLDDFRNALKEMLDKETIADLYARKSTVWQHESEYRQIVVRWNVPDLEIDNPLFYPIEHSLRAVVVGERFGDTLRLLRSIDGFDDDARPELFRCVWEGGLPDVRH